MLRGAEDGADLGHVQPAAVPVHHRVEDLLHRRAVGEQFVACDDDAGRGGDVDERTADRTADRVTRAIASSGGTE